jgi:hypothetical protein
MTAAATTDMTSTTAASDMTSAATATSRTMSAATTAATATSHEFDVAVVLHGSRGDAQGRRKYLT